MGPRPFRPLRPFNDVMPVFAGAAVGSGFCAVVTTFFVLPPETVDSSMTIGSADVVAAAVALAGTSTYF